jgi:hypothetical protein
MSARKPAETSGSQYGLRFHVPWIDELRNEALPTKSSSVMVSSCSIDRRGIEDRACECYGKSNMEFNRRLGADLTAHGQLSETATPAR